MARRTSRSLRDRFGPGDDAFEALERAREQVQSDGWRVGLTGCRLDARPSGMARDMGSGLRVYIFSAGSRPTAGDLADTFAPADLELVGDVTEQRARIQALTGMRL